MEETNNTPDEAQNIVDESKLSPEDQADLNIGKITQGLKTCLRCKHTWVSRQIEEPRMCPRCKRYNWKVRK